MADKNCVLYLEHLKESQCILIHGYVIDTALKYRSLKYSTWTTGPAGYMKGNREHAVPVSAFIDAIMYNESSIDNIVESIRNSTETTEVTVLTYRGTDISKKYNIKYITKLYNDPGVERIMILEQLVKNRVVDEDGYMKISEPDDYFIYRPDRPTVTLGSKSILVDKSLSTTDDRVLHCINHSKEDEVGRKASSVTYMVVELDCEYSYIRTLEKRLLSFRHNKLYPTIIYLDNYTKPRTSAVIKQFEKYGLIAANTCPLVLVAADGSVVAREVDPPILARSTISIFKNLRSTLETFKRYELGEDIPGVYIEEITDTFIKDGAVKDEFKTKKTATVSVKTDIVIDIKILLGNSLPDRNSLTKMVKKGLSIFVVVAHAGDGYVYDFVIKIKEEGVAVWGSPYTNRVIPLTK